MKKKLVIILGILLLNITINKAQHTDVNSGATVINMKSGNSMFHASKTVKLKTGILSVNGEVKFPGVIDLSQFYLHEIVVKEAGNTENDKNEFTGAYRYIGYSLYDLLEPYILSKNNAETFKPEIDLYIVIKNDKGESVVFSWSEIFHTNILHQVLIAIETAVIKPHKAEVNYPINKSWKIVAGNDLFSFRNLENPSSITVCSFNQKDYPIDSTISPMYSQEVKVIIDNKELMKIPLIKDKASYIKYYTNFFGMGLGYHKNPYFEGIPLNTFMLNQINQFDKETIKHGLVCFASIDGYRSIFSFSELFNRNDQLFPILAVPENPNEGGFYRIFLPSDFFADRSVKSMNEIYFFKTE